MNIRTSPILMLSLLLLSACKDGLGRPVVDRTREGRGEDSCESTRRVRCDDAIGAPRELDVGADPALPPCLLGARLTGSRITGSLQSCRLVLDASAAEEIEITDSTLDNVLIQLDGRVELRIAESRLFEVTIQGPDPVDPERPPLVQITHSNLGWTRIDADLFELTSSYLERVLLDVGRLSAVDIKTKESLLMARHGTISAGKLSATQIGGGDTLLVAGSQAINSRFAAGEGVTRIYDSEVTGGNVDGQLEADVGTFADCRFGVDAPTQLRGWFTSINNSVLCAGLEQVRYSSGNITCSRCEGPLSMTDADVCTDVAFLPAFEDNGDCGALLEPAVCDMFPRDARPFDF
jgi:hypothetical protein